MHASANFYDTIFEKAEMNKISTEKMTYWMCEEFAFAIAEPFNEEPASNGNGTMVGFDVGSKDEVIRLYEKVIEMGGTSEGEPGDRGPRFSAYVRDLDKNKICLFK